MYKKNDNSPAKPWQPRWWRENPERWRWAGTIALVFMLMGAFAYQNPHIWQNIVPAQLAEDETLAPDTGAVLPEPQAQQPIAAQAEQPAVEDVGGAAPSLADEQPAAEAAATQQPAPEDTEPAGMQQLEAAIAVAVSAAPTSWQQPGYGLWSRGYGYALDPTQGDYRFHHGCDMDLDVGSPVFAATAGKVLLAANDTAWGGVVIVEHGGGWRSVYKCVKPEISIGATVVAGEQIGLILPSPPAEQAQASHLHFEMELDNEKQDPAQWL